VKLRDFTDAMLLTLKLIAKYNIYIFMHDIEHVQLRLNSLQMQLFSQEYTYTYF